MKEEFIIEKSKTRNGPWEEVVFRGGEFISYDLAKAAIPDAKGIWKANKGRIWVRIRREGGTRAAHVFPGVKQ